MYEEGEQRWHALGLVGGRYLLVVVHAYREAEDGEEIIRIPERAATGVSAREASKRERRIYFQ